MKIKRILHENFLELYKTYRNSFSIIENVLWLYADRVIRMGLGFFISAWIARYLGSEDFGIYSFALAVVGLFTPLAALGLRELTIRSLANNPERKNEFLGTTFLLHIFGGIVTYILSLLLVVILIEQPTIISLVAILSISGIFNAFDIIDYWFSSQVKSKYSVIAQNTAFMVLSSTKLILILMSAPLIFFAWAVVIGSIVKASALSVAYRLKGYYLRLWKWEIALARDFLRESWPLILSSIAVTVYMKTDVIMLGQMDTKSAVGIYSVAIRLSEIWYFIPSAIAASVAPKFYAAKRYNDPKRYNSILKRLLRTVFVISILIALPLTLLSDLLITKLYGQAYSLAGSIVSIYIWSAPFVFMGIAANLWFIAEGLMQETFKRSMMGAIINILLNFLMIPRYGIFGAAISTVVSQAFASFLLNSINKKTRELFWLQVRTLIFI
jgi:PST family polysaccharide transporter